MTYIGAMHALAPRSRLRRTRLGPPGWARLALAWLLWLAADRAQADNAYLQAADAKPVEVELAGTEWGDDIDGGERKLAARMSTTRLAVLPYGAVFRIEFVSLPAGGAMPRAIPRLLLLATPQEIAILPSGDEAATLQRLQSQKSPPPIAAEAVRAIARGQRPKSRTRGGESWLRVVGDLCTYRYAHPAGHFTTLVWQRGVGLVEYATGRGARADGFRLRRRSSVTK